MLKVKSLCLKYPNDDRKIFDNLNIEIKDKERVLLLGPSGSDKSILLNVLSGIVPNLIELPMKYDELDIDPNSGVIFQDPDTQFCMPEVYEELAFTLENQQVPKENMDEQIKKALASIDLDVDSSTFVNNLSGGMKQKLAIVETVLQKADTLFLNEPTATLDIQATADLWQRLIQLWADQTVLIVEHKVEHVWHHVDRVILMDYDEEVIADNTPEYILKHCESLLTEFGVWRPYARDYAPVQADLTPQTSKTLFKFQNGQMIHSKNTPLKVPELNIHPEEWITVTGRNGAGKTTLLGSMMQLMKYNGTMFYENRLLRKIKDAAQNMYPAYQNLELQFITNPVYDEINIRHNHLDKAKSKEGTEHLLKLLHLEKVKYHHPFEVPTGQKRRLSVATALSSKAETVLLDEPAFGLDSHNTFQLIKLFRERVKQGQTIVMVTHDPGIIHRYPTRRLVVESHKLLEMAGESDV